MPLVDIMTFLLMLHKKCIVLTCVILYIVCSVICIPFYRYYMKFKIIIYQTMQTVQTRKSPSDFPSSVRRAFNATFPHHQTGSKSYRNTSNYCSFNTFFSVELYSLSLALCLVRESQYRLLCLTLRASQRPTSPRDCCSSCSPEPFIAPVLDTRNTCTTEPSGDIYC